MIYGIYSNYCFKEGIKLYYPSDFVIIKPTEFKKLCKILSYLNINEDIKTEEIYLFFNQGLILFKSRNNCSLYNFNKDLYSIYAFSLKLDTKNNFGYNPELIISFDKPEDMDNLNKLKKL